MKLSRLIVLLACLAPIASSQIVGVRLANEKLERKYKKFLTKMNGRYYIVGERKSGFTMKGNNITITAKEEIELFVVDQSKPGRVPYKVDRDGNRVVTNKKGVVAIKRDHLPASGAIRYLMRSQTISGLASEYRLRMEALERLETRRNEFKKASTEWFKAQRELINAMERMQGWLQANSFVRAAQKYGKYVAKELKNLKEDAVAERYAMAKEAIRKIEVPEEVVKAAEATGCAQRMIAYEGQHLRVIVCGSFIEEEAARRLVELGELVFEGFRREIIDPWVEDEEGFEDNTPDTICSEFLFIPDDVSIYERFYTAIGGTWGKNKAESLKMSGMTRRGLRGVTYFHFQKATAETDFEGVITHGLGHDTCNIHFNRHGPGSPQPWLGEAMGYYASFEFLGRNTVTCKGFKEATYDRPKGKEGVKTVQQGQRAAFNQLALKRGIAISEIIQRDLFDLDDADLAKSWSLLDYILHEEGRQGIEFLRACCFYGKNRATLVKELRATARTTFNLPESKEPLQWLDDRWRAFAKSGQETGDSHRKRR